MLPDDSIRNVDENRDGKIEGFQFKLRNPWYTSQPISSLVKLIISVDGEKFETDKVRLNVRGQEIVLPKAYTMYDVNWGFPELIDVFVEKAGGLKPGNHELSCEIVMRSTIEYGLPEEKINFPTKKLMKVLNEKEAKMN